MKSLGGAKGFHAETTLASMTDTPSSVPFRPGQDLAMVETRTHAEQMRMDMGALLCSAFPDLAREADRLRVPRFLERMREGGRVLLEAYGEAAWSRAQQHPNDVVRGWGAFAAGMSTSTWPSLIDRVEPFADDSHFAVREWAWLSVRAHVVEAPLTAVERLITLTGSSSDRVRRFACESTRPRSVWGAHVIELKKEPWLAEGLLRPLAGDTSRYVQLSLGNWLNDVAASHEDWVRTACTEWLGDVASAIARKRALRRVN